MSNNTIFVTGDIKGNIDGLLKYLDKMSKKMPTIDFVFCVGDFFGTDLTDIKRCIAGEIKINFPIFFTCTISKNVEEIITNVTGCELCPNLTFLGQQGVYRDATGLTVVYFSCASSTTTSEKNPPANMKQLLTQCGAQDVDYIGVDLLLSDLWPENVAKFLPSNILPNTQIAQIKGSRLIALFAQLLRPRYHFVGNENLYFQRPPYRNHRILQEKAKHVTRFFALANFDNKDGEKFVTAVRVSPMSKMDRKLLLQAPEFVTECPYVSLPAEAASSSGGSSGGGGGEQKSSGPPKRVGDNQYFFAQPGGDTNRSSSRTGGQFSGPKKMRQSTLTPDKCWFCLGNAEAEKHLVVSVGDHSYIALAKGPLHPQHALIVPISHFPSLLQCPPEVVNEINAFRRALRKFFSEKLDCETVVFERNFHSQHLQLQVVPVPKGSNETCKLLFLSEASRLCGETLQLDEIPRSTVLSEVVDVKKPYFHVILNDGSQLFGCIDTSKATADSRFDLQFGRVVLANSEILNVVDKVDWKKSLTNKDEEIVATQEFRKMFAPFDIQ